MSNYLPVDLIDRADRLIYQATGLLDLIGAASTSERQAADDSFEAASWLARDMLEQLKAIVNAEPQA